MDGEQRPPLPPRQGDKWFTDPRISSTEQFGQEAFESGIDRGHLTRREDTAWGTDPEDATRANNDTFHFTNCTPQHWMFNEKAKFWQGLERYVLENGALQVDPKAVVCVFQGPIFNDGIDHWADDVQIPSSFWKIVVWKGHDKLKAVGLVADQLAIIDIARKPSAPPPDCRRTSCNSRGEGICAKAISRTLWFSIPIRSRTSPFTTSRTSIRRE